MTNRSETESRKLEVVEPFLPSLTSVQGSSLPTPRERVFRNLVVPRAERLLTLLQSHTRYWDLTQGSAKPPPWAKLSYTFGVFVICPLSFRMSRLSRAIVLPGPETSVAELGYQCRSRHHDLCDNTNTKRSKRLKTPRDLKTRGHRHWRSEQ